MRRRSSSSYVLGAGIVAALVVASLVGAAAPAAGAAPGLRPVFGRAVALFRPPSTRYGRGHLGVDFAATPGAAVRAVDPGTVVFAGPVGGSRHVVVRDARGRRVSYSFLASITVQTGERVRRGEAIGTTGGIGSHHDGSVLHLGLRIGDTYVDPMQLFGESATPAFVVHLVPNDAGIAPRRRSRPAPARRPPDEVANLVEGLGVDRTGSRPDGVRVRQSGPGRRY